jgi:hypothetical protein
VSRIARYGAWIGEIGLARILNKLERWHVVSSLIVHCQYIFRETFSVIFLHGADDHMMSPTRQPPSRRRIKSMKAFLKVKEVLGKWHDILLSPMERNPLYDNEYYLT